MLVPGITDDEGHLRRMRSFIDSLDNVKRVEVLPYHMLGVYKWEQLGLKYTLGDVQPPSAEQVKRVEAIL